MFKKGLSWLLALLMVVSLIPVSVLVTAFAEGTDDINSVSESTIVDSDTWGGVDWTLTTDGTLTITPTDNEITDKKHGDKTKYYERGQVPCGANLAWTAYYQPWSKSEVAVKKLIIEEGVTSIGTFAFMGMKKLTGEVVIPSSVTYIGQDCFNGTPITKLTFAAGGAKELCIAHGAFKKLQIEEVSLPSDRPVHLHAWVFQYCANLKHVTLPATLTSVHGTNHLDYLGNPNAHVNPSWTTSSDLFADCPSMKSITCGSKEVMDMFLGADGNAATVAKYGITVELKKVAQIGETGYATLAAALKEAKDGDTITLLADCAEDVTISKAVTINGQGFTLGGTVKLAVPAGNETMKFVNVVFKTANANGIYVSATSYNVTFDACTFKGANSYAFEIPAGTSANNFRFINECEVDMSGNFMQILGTASDMLVDGMHIVNCSNGFKVNKCGNAITFNEVTVDSAYIFIYGMGNSDMSFAINNCTIKAAFPFVRQDKAVMTYTYTFTGENVVVADPDPTAPVAPTEYDGLYLVRGSDMGSTVVWNVPQPAYVAQIGEQGFETLAKALEAANDGDTITFLEDINENVTIDKSVTIDGAGKTFSGTMTVNGVGVTLTVKNATLKAAGSYVIYTEQSNVTIEKCTLTSDATIANSYGSKAIVFAKQADNSNVKISECEISNLYYPVYFTQGGKSLVIEHSTITDCIYLSSAMKCKDVTIEDVTYTGLAGMPFRNTSGEMLLKDVNITTTGTGLPYMPVVMFSPEKANEASKYTIYLQGENIANGVAMTIANEAAWFARQDESNPYEIIDLNKKPVMIGEVGYDSLSAALAAAKDGDTIKLVDNIVLNSTVNFNKGVAVTLDLNGFTITGDGMNATTLVYVTGGCKLTIVDNTADKKGGIHAINTVSLDNIIRVETDAFLTIESGNFTQDKSNNGCGMIDSRGDEIIVVNGGYFYLYNVGSASNNSPWVFNTSGQNTKNITVNGGTFNADIAHQYYPFEVITPREKALVEDENGMWSYVDAVIYVIEQHWSSAWYQNEIGYASLEEAIAFVERESTRIRPSESIIVIKDIVINGTVTIPAGNMMMTDGTATVTMTPNSKIVGNYIDDIVPPAGYTVLKTGEGDSQVISLVRKNVAEIGGVQYPSLKDAIAAVQDGDIIKVLLDHELDGTSFVKEGNFGYDVLLVIEQKAITIDFNGKIVTVTPDCPDADAGLKDCLEAVIFLRDGASLTLKDSVGGGGLYAKESATTGLYSFIYNSGCTLIIEGGNYTVDTVKDSVFYTDFGPGRAFTPVTAVKGGTFNLIKQSAINASNKQNKPWIFNSQGSWDYFAQVTGGTYNQNIMINYGTAYDCEVDIPETHVLVDNGDGTWSVVIAVARIGNVEYGSLKDAIAAAQDGDIIKVLLDHELDGTSFVKEGNFGYDALLVIEQKAITIDFNGKIVTVTPDCPDADAGLKDCLEAVIFLRDGASLTLKDSVGGGGLYAKESATTGLYSFIYNSGCTLIIEGGNYTVDIVKDSMFYTDFGPGKAYTPVTAVKGGTFNLIKQSAINASNKQNKPWIFNSQGSWDYFAQVTGGTYNQNIMINYGTAYDCEVNIPDTHELVDNGDGTWAVQLVAPFNVKRSAQIRLIEPWGLKVNFALLQNGQVIDYTSLKDYSVYFVRASAFEDGATVDVDAILNHAQAYKVSADQMFIAQDNSGLKFLSAIYDQGLYTYQFSDSIYVLLCTVDENGSIRYDLSERNISQLINDRKDNAKYDELEREVYAKMAQLEKDILIYRESMPSSSDTNDTLPQLFKDHKLESGAFCDESLNQQAAQIRLIEPWGLKLSACFKDANGHALDYSAYEEIGALVYVDKGGVLGDNVSLADIMKDNAYVFSSTNGNVTLNDDGSFTVIYTGDIYTYQLNTDIYVAFYLKDADGNYTYGKLLNRNIYQLMSVRLNKSGEVSDKTAKQNAVYADMIDLCDVVTAFRDDYFAKQENK